MNEKARLLIVWNDMVIAAKISLQLSQLGYEVTGIAPLGEDAIHHIRENKPDIILMDLQLKGEMKVQTEIESMEDRIFIRSQNKLIKLMLKDILYMEADRNYCKIFTTHHSYTIVCSLGNVFKKITHKNFIRIHRSYLVNIEKLDAIRESFLEIGDKVIPISKGNKGELFKRMNRL